FSLFLFSSSRRHTISKRDWSSDVCSSDLLSALNTGHPGSITTTHSNSAVDTYNRLAMLVKQSPTGGQLDLHTIQQFLRNTVDIIVYFERFKLREIYFEPLPKRLNH